MKLDEHIEGIRKLIFKSFDKQLSRLGLSQNNIKEAGNIPDVLIKDRKRMINILKNLKQETGDYSNSREKLIDEVSFTLFNRIAGIKVMENRQLIPEYLARRETHGGRSFSHKLWLEQNPEKSKLKLEGLYEFVRYSFNELSKKIHLYSSDYLYDLLPDVYDLNDIIDKFNNIEDTTWSSDDILGWMYEYYNRKKRKEFKSTGKKIEYDKVSLSSQIYTPRWVVEFLLNNSLGKLWMEMYPESELKENHDIANIPNKPILEEKPVQKIKVLDPAVGSGNFLLYAYDLFYEMYLEEGKTSEADIPQKIIENNLYGIDLDDRAVQIAQLGLYIKALEKNQDIHIEEFNVVSTDFCLPDYDEISDLFFELDLHEDSRYLLETIWDDLRLAYKFGSLIRVEEKVNDILEEYKIKKQRRLWDSDEKTIWNEWQQKIIPKIKDAIREHTSNNNVKSTFLESKTIDSLTFVEILRNKYDVIVTNPPYTDSSNYGSELKKFIGHNYKKPQSFYPNLFACFLKRNTELLKGDGKTGIIHPLTFMYIKSYEDMRKYILDKFHINILVEYGLSDLFGEIMADPAFYILEKDGKYSDNQTLFISMNQYTRTPEENYKEQYTNEALRNYIKDKDDKNNYLLDQSKLKIIESYPFIYWISDEFREKFAEKPIDKFVDVRAGVQTSNNPRFLRFWWEVDRNSISDNQKGKKRWVKYIKGGPFGKWYGNLWLLIDWERDGKKLRNYLISIGQDLHAQNYYFKRGITYSASGSKGISFRYFQQGFIFDIGGSSLFLVKDYRNLFYFLGFLNSKLVFNITKLLNPTVNIQPNDIKRIPFVFPTDGVEDKISLLANKNVTIKKHLCEFSLIEMNYKHHPLIWAKEKKESTDLKGLLKTYLDYENKKLAHIYLNEAIIDDLIFKVYDLTEKDKEMVLNKEGIPVGSFPLVRGYEDFDEELPDFTNKYFNELEVKEFSNSEFRDLKNEIENFYKNNLSVEDISKKIELNPISIVRIIKESSVIPEKRINDLARDFLFDLVREVLNEDNDGIVPLVSFSGEEKLQKRLFDKFIEKGFSSSQIGNYQEILGKPIDNYLRINFFKDLCDRLNLFMYLPKTPFIWHISAGRNDGFEAFIIIYKWSRDKMLRLRSVYVEKRESSLKNRLIDLEKDDSIKAQSEKEIIGNQIEEIRYFKKAIDEVLQSGYDPKLDDGVGKNIAPLQEKGILKSDVLTESQLEKYLNADW